MVMHIGMYVSYTHQTQYTLNHKYTMHHTPYTYTHETIRKCKYTFTKMHAQHTHTHTPIQTYASSSSLFCVTISARNVRTSSSSRSMSPRYTLHFPSRAWMCTCICECVCIYVYVYVFMCMHLGVCMYRCMYICIGLW
ncbi:hypothetical protein EON63_24370 [archaeon]|nr:MAG: hypothetical protein EON63_24370 [archaeon]